MKKTIIAVVISGATTLGLALSSSVALAQTSEPSSTSPSTVNNNTDSSNQQSTSSQLSQDVKNGWDKTKQKATDVKDDIKDKYHEEKAKHDDNEANSNNNTTNTNTTNNNDNATSSTSQSVKHGWDKTKEKASDAKNDVKDKYYEEKAKHDNKDNMNGKEAKTTNENLTQNKENGTDTANKHRYTKTHYKAKSVRVHHDINWSADQHMSRTGYQAPPQGWNGLGKPSDIPTGDNPKWYNVNYGYNQDETNNHNWHHYHHKWNKDNDTTMTPNDGNNTNENATYDHQ